MIRNLSCFLVDERDDMKRMELEVFTVEILKKV